MFLWPGTKRNSWGLIVQGWGHYCVSQGSKLRLKKYESSWVTINLGIHVKKYSEKVFMICSLWQGSFLIPSKNPLRHSPCFGAPKTYHYYPTNSFDSRAEFYENKKISRGIHQDCLLSGVKTVLIKSRLPSSYPHGSRKVVSEGKKTTAKCLWIAFAKIGLVGHIVCLTVRWVCLKINAYCQ